MLVFWAFACLGCKVLVARLDDEQLSEQAVHGSLSGLSATLGCFELDGALLCLNT